MEEIILVLMLFVVINSAFKLSFWKWWQAALFGLLAAAFTACMYPYAIQQSKTQIADYLQNKEALQDMAIVITLESAVCFSFCVTYLRGMYGKKNPWWAKALWWYPSLLLFPVLFYCLTELIFACAGVSFSLVAYVMAAVVLAALPLLAKCVAWLVPEPDFRLEVHFLVSLFICMLGLLTTVNGETVYAAVDEPVNWHAVALSVILFAGLFLVGFVWNRFKFWLAQRLRKRKAGIRHAEAKGGQNRL